MKISNRSETEYEVGVFPALLLLFAPLLFFQYLNTLWFLLYTARGDVS